MNEETTTEESSYDAVADNFRNNVQIAQYTEAENRRMADQEQVAQQTGQGAAQNKKHVPWVPLLGMLLLAVVVDALSLLLDLLPFIGWALDVFVVTPISIFLFWIYCKLTGLPLFKGVRKFVTPFAIIIGFIPIINAIPEWTFEVLALIFISMAEVYGGKMLKMAPNFIKKRAANLLPQKPQPQTIQEVAEPRLITQNEPQPSKSPVRPILQTSSSPSRKPPLQTGSLIRK